MIQSASLLIAFLSLVFSVFLSTALAGCLCRNYSGKPFCAETILSCQKQAGNCMEECSWRKGDESKKKQWKDPKNKSMLVF
jgi:hypothetical protein